MEGVPVGLDYHVEIEKHYYSVPHQLLREKVWARITARTVEIFHCGKRVAADVRSSSNRKHTTMTSPSLVNLQACSTQQIEQDLPRPHGIDGEGADVFIGGRLLKSWPELQICTTQLAREGLRRWIAPTSGEVVAEFQSDSTRTDSPVRVLNAQPRSRVSEGLSGNGR
jgi:hypothetical protein